MASLWMIGAGGKGGEGKAGTCGREGGAALKAGCAAVVRKLGSGGQGARLLAVCERETRKKVIQREGEVDQSKSVSPPENFKRFTARCGTTAVHTSTTAVHNAGRWCGIASAKPIKRGQNLPTPGFKCTLLLCILLLRKHFIS